VPYAARIYRPPRLAGAKQPEVRPEWRQLYGRRWQVYRIAFFANPENAICKWPDCHSPANTIDHIAPHKGDYELFWDPTNHQGLCKHHHDVKTATEDGGFGRGKK